MSRRPLAGAFEKVRRANEHIKALDDEVGGLERDKPYNLVPRTDMQCIERIEVPRTESDPSVIPSFVPLVHAETMGIYLVVERPLPVLRWGSMIGDAPAVPLGTSGAAEMLAMIGDIA